MMHGQQNVKCCSESNPILMFGWSPQIWNGKCLILNRISRGKESVLTPNRLNVLQPQL